MRNALIKKDCNDNWLHQKVINEDRPHEKLSNKKVIYW